MSESLVVIATFRPKPDSADDLLAVVRDYVPAAQQDDGNLQYALHEAGEGVLVLIEHWSDQQTFEGHGATPGFTAFSEALQPFLAGPLEVRVLRPVPIGDPAKGAL
jgi:quinol monooxygenase YgiN